MVKKLAVVTAAMAATLLALSPLAFATDAPSEDGDNGPVIGDVNSPNDQVGLVNLDDVNVLNGTNLCGLLGASDIACESLSNNNN